MAAARQQLAAQRLHTLQVLVGNTHEFEQEVRMQPPCHACTWTFMHDKCHHHAQQRSARR